MIGIPPTSIIGKGGKVDNTVPVCRNCNRAIWRHVYGEETIWRHYSSFMLCQPDEDAPDFNVEHIADPLTEEEYLLLESNAD